MAINLYQQYRRYSAYTQPIFADPVLRSYFSLIASLLLIAFLVIFALSPTVNIILGLRKKIDDQNRTLKALDAKVTALVSAQDTYARLESQLPLLDRAMPFEPVAQDVVVDLHKTASVAGVSVSGLQFGPVYLSPRPNDSTIVFSTAAVSSETKIRFFLGDLEDQLRYIRLKNLSLGWNAKQPGTISANISGTAFYYPQL